jgi:cytochrome c biogenesis protein CcdA
MTTTLILSLFAAALLDSFNPSLFLAQFYLLTTPRPAPRILSYIAGIVVAYFIGGWLLLNGAQAFLANWLQSIDMRVGAVLQIGIGILLLAFAVWYKGESSDEARKPKSLRLGYTFLFGMVVIINEIPTAFPYFVAIEQLGSARLSAPLNAVLLLGYNLVFVIPLLLFLALFMAFRERFTHQITAITTFIQRWTPRILKVAAALIGILFIIGGLHDLLTAG